MMMHGIAVLLTLGAAASIPPGERADDLAVLRANYDAIAQAFATGDTASILALRTADHYVVYPNGSRQSAAEQAQVLDYFFVQNRPPIRIQYTVRCSAFPSDDEAVLVIFQQVSRMQEIAGAMRLVESDIIQREGWRRTPDGWRHVFVDKISFPHRWIDRRQVEPGAPYDEKIRGPEFVPPPVPPFDCEDMLRSETSEPMR